MASANHPAFLRLVHSENDAARPQNKIASSGAAQNLFFPTDSPNTLIFVDWEHISLVEFMDILECSRPRVVFDFRITPHFDLETLSRKRFFSILEQSNCQYVDLFGRLGITNVRAAAANPILIAREIGAIAAELTPSNRGPFVFLHDDEHFDDAYVHALAINLPAHNLSWQVFRPFQAPAAIGVRQTSGSPIVRASEVHSLQRKTIFISHATPEDNHFVKWLATKLTLAGYEVWSDITELQGGDVFWGDIENVIRSRAAKVIFVHSEFAKAKAGTRKEVYLALKVGERIGISRFVIPVRIDNSGFDETFIELVDIQSIDCRGDWLLGLKSLVALLHRDGVPRAGGISSDRFADLVGKVSNPSFSLVRSQEILISSWLEISDPPTKVNFYSCAGLMPNELGAVAAALNIPAFAYFALLATTAELDRTKDALTVAGFGYAHLTSRISLTWAQFVSGQWDNLPQAYAGEARRHASTLLNKAVINFMETRKLQSDALANGRPFWFFASSKLPKNEVKFLDFKGQMIRRQLVGYSNKRHVFWHFGLQIRSTMLGNEAYFFVSPHVTFSTDGIKPLSSKAQLHALRRSFCRSWWNKRWRDLMQGFVAAIAEGTDHLEIDVGGDRPLVAAAVFKKFVSPVSPQAAEATSEISEEDDIQDDWEEIEEAELDELGGSEAVNDGSEDVT